MKEYNGWTNWETWNLYNWVSSNEYLYRYLEARTPWRRVGLRTCIMRIYAGNLPDHIDPDKVNWRELVEAVNDF